MTRTDLWKVSEILFYRTPSRGRPQSRRVSRAPTRSRQLADDLRGSLKKYPGFLELSFLKEILPEEFGT